MKWEELREIETFITREVNEAIASDEAAALWVTMTLQLYYGGNQGETSEEDQAANLGELEAGRGRIVTKWERPENSKLNDNILIITYFDEEHRGDIDYNNTLVMYCHEY